MPAPAAGTRPEGVAPEAAPRYVRALFDRIAPRYDRANHWLSLSADRYWRWRAAREVALLLAAGGERRILDLCCGTGDMARALAARGRGWRIVGSDFSHPMLRLARGKAPGLGWVEGDALCLPVADASVDAITTAFGFRNLADYRGALGEFHRVLKPGGALAILEFSEPTLPLLGPLYGWYFHRILPRLGGWIAGTGEPYRYLPASVARFPAPAELSVWVVGAGFVQVRCRRLTGGIACLHTAKKGTA